MSDLAGRVALVTGAGSGIGRAVALRLRSAGAALAALDVDRASAERTAAALGDRALAVAADVADAVAVDRAFAEVEATLGPVDILANVAGIYGVHAPIREQTLANWRRVLDVNLHGTFLCTRRALPTMLDRGYGRIVNIASGAALGPRPGIAPYAASKGAVIGFTKAVALEVASRGVTVNAVLPGVTDTPMPRQYGSEERLVALARANPMGRIGRPADIAAAVAFLATEDAAYITGQTVAVNGGVRQLP